MSDRPKRIQLSRKRGWRMPENTVKVDRSTIWGNLHPGSRWDDDEWEFGPYPSCQHCMVDCYRRWITGDASFIRWWRGTVWGCASQMTGDRSLNEVRRRLPELRDKNLACWCRLCDRHAAGKPAGVQCEACAPCHADVLLELANEAAP
jgi:hypothetical protein